MKKISIVIVSALTFVLTAFLVGCQNPASVSGGNTDNNNSNSGIISNPQVQIPSEINDDNIITEPNIYPIVNNNTGNVDFFLNFTGQNIYPDTLEPHILQNSSNVPISSISINVYSSAINSNAPDPTHASARYWLQISIPKTYVDAMTSPAYIYVTQKSHNFIYRSNMSAEAQLQTAWNVRIFNDNLINK